MGNVHGAAVSCQLSAVTVDGVQESRKTAKIRAGQVVRLDDERIEVRAPVAK